ncbi:MAG: DNA repair protein RecN [Fibrobacter sp.]|nr:DNA repair protein RecN [Fibrobacter sp.]
MLKQLTIDGFTLIAHAEVPFRKGFTAITGETGAGKSVLLKALHVICGEKAPASLVRNGEEKAVVEATFDISGLTQVKTILEEIGIDSDDELVIRREVLENGKGRSRINGSMVNQGDLQRIGEELIQMHGQSEQILLRDTRTHIQMLDAFAYNGGLLELYAKFWSEWNKIQSQIVETEERAKNLAAQKDFLKFQYEELTKAALKQGEEESLEEKVSSASKSESERRLLGDIQGMLSGEGGLLDQVQTLAAKMRSLAIKCPGYDDELKSVEEVLDPFESVCKDLMRLTPSAAMSAQEIDRANSRIAQIQKLKRKYRTDVNGLIELTEQRRTELESLENLDADLEELARQASKAMAELEKVANELTERRKEAASRYDNSVSSILNTLGMPKAEFTTSIEKQALSVNGQDRVEFLLAPNAGEGFKSLQKAASGGELSRLLLSIKTVMASLDQVPLLIFDEVDSGISGEIGNNIGDALKKLGEHHQILTITHLHQVASRAKNQLAVNKQEINGRTFTTIRELDYEGRVSELSRMLGGDSETIREHARQLLENNQ